MSTTALRWGHSRRRMAGGSPMYETEDGRFEYRLARDHRGHNVPTIYRRVPYGAAGGQRLVVAMRNAVAGDVKLCADCQGEGCARCSLGLVRKPRYDLGMRLTGPDGRTGRVILVDVQDRRYLLAYNADGDEQGPWFAQDELRLVIA